MKNFGFRFLVYFLSSSLGNIGQTHLLRGIEFKHLRIKYIKMNEYGSYNTTDFKNGAI